MSNAGGTVECSCGRPTSGARLCGDCQVTFAVAIGNIAAHYADLEVIETKRARYGGGGATVRTIGKAQPLPIDMRFADVTGRGTQAKWDAWQTIVAWCRTVMEDQPPMRGPACHLGCLHVSCATVKRRRWPSNTFQSMCLYLDRQFRWIVREDWAPVILDELLDVERRLKALTDRPADKWYAGKCSAFTREHGSDGCPTELYATVDRGYVDCPSCKARHDVGERRTYLLSEARDYLVTATEAAGALLAWTDFGGSEDKLVDRIRKWHKRGQLEARSMVILLGRDRNLYRLGDIQALLIADAQAANNAAQSKAQTVG